MLLQGRRDSNPRPTVLETVALPTVPHPYAISLAEFFPPSTNQQHFNDQRIAKIEKLYLTIEFSRLNRTSEKYLCRNASPKDFWRN